MLILNFVSGFNGSWSIYPSLKAPECQVKPHWSLCCATYIAGRNKFSFIKKIDLVGLRQRLDRLEIITKGFLNLSNSLC